MIHGLLVNTKHTTGFTCKYFPLISYYPQVLSAQQDSLTNINLSVITRKQCIACVAQAQHVSYVSSKFLKAQRVAWIIL